MSKAILTNDLEQEDDKAGDRQFISALDRGIGILKCFTSISTELSTNDMLALTGLSKTTLFRLTYTLCKLGLLRYSERLGKYSLTPKILTLGAPLLERATIRQLAYAHMQALANQAQGHVSLALVQRSDLHIVYIEIAHMPKAMSTGRPSEPEYPSPAHQQDVHIWQCSSQKSAKHISVTPSPPTRKRATT